LPNAATSLGNQAVDARQRQTTRRKDPPPVAAIRSIAGAFRIVPLRAIVPEKTARLSGVAQVSVLVSQCPAAPGELTANRQIRARSERAVRKIEAGAIPPKGGAQWDIAASAVLLV